MEKMATLQTTAKVPSRPPINPWMPPPEASYIFDLEWPPGEISMPPFVAEDTGKLVHLSWWLGQNGHKWGTAICHAARTKNVQMLWWLIQTSRLEFKQMLEQTKLTLKIIDSMRGELESTIPEWLAVITALIAEVVDSRYNIGAASRSVASEADPFTFAAKIERMMHQLPQFRDKDFWEDRYAFAVPFPPTAACMTWYYGVVSLRYPVLERPAEAFREAYEKQGRGNFLPLALRMRRNHECVRLVRHLVGWINLAGSPDSSGKTALMYAAESGDLEVVNVLLQFGELTLQETDPQWRAIVKSVNMEAKDYHQGKTALFFAASSSHADTVKGLLDAGADIEAMDENGRTALFDAVIGRDLETFDVLLRSGANIHARDSQGRSLLFYAVNAEVCGKLLKKGVEIERKDENGMTALFCAVEKGNLELVDLLLRSGANIHATDSQERSLLFYAVNAEVCGKLLKKGVEIERKDENGMTALFHAVEKGNLEFVDLLLRSGANIHARDSQGRSLLFYAVNAEVCAKLLKEGVEIERKDENGMTALFRAVEIGNLEFVDLLLRSGANIYARDSQGRSLLFYAVNAEVCAKLLKEGVELQRRDNQGKTALFNAVARENLELIDRLLKSAANINATDLHGKNVLFYAAESKWRDRRVVDLLLESGANVDATDSDGKPVLFYAVKCGCVDTIHQLLTAGIAVEGRKRKEPTTASSETTQWDRFELLNALLEANTSVRSDYLSYLIDNAKSVEYLKEFLLAGGLIRTEVSATGTNAHLISYHRILAELLHHAIWRYAHSVVEFLLRIGVDLEARTKAGATALIAASWARNTVMVKDLISRGADMEAKDNLGETALHKAISKGNVQLVKWLVENGANIDAKDSAGKKPSQQASAMGDSELAAWLTDYEKKSYSDLSLQYADDVFRAVRGKFTRIERTFAKHQCNMLCLAGFDYAPSWYKYSELDDKGFFTGNRPHLISLQ